MSNLIQGKTPEEQELEKKQAELLGLEIELAQRELELANVNIELHLFEKEYLHIIGTRYIELDRVEALIAEYIASAGSAKDFKPTEKLKKLYREVAKRIHPDLATDQAERLYRQELMVAANQAYETGDEERLKAILIDWETKPESFHGEGVAASLIRVIRKIAQVQNRLHAINKEFTTLEQTDIGQLKERIKSANAAGIDLMAEMVKELDCQIAHARKNLYNLQSNNYTENQ
jgi:DnaJ-domain-containing protein 1